MPDLEVTLKELRREVASINSFSRAIVSDGEATFKLQNLL